MSKITKIEDLQNYEMAVENSQYTDSYEGYLIETETDNIKILIDNRADCCESWGHLASDDNLASFIGAEFLGLEIIDRDLATIEVGDLDNGDAIFVNVKTSLGILQFAVYNAHNGYYGHRVKIIQNEKILLEDTL